MQYIVVHTWEWCARRLGKLCSLYGGLALYLLKPEPAHRVYNRNVVVQVFSQSEAMASDSHVSSATLCLELQPSVTPMPLSEDTVRNEGLYIQELHRVKMWVRGAKDLQIGG